MATAPITVGRLKGQHVDIVFHRDAMFYLLLDKYGPVGEYLVSQAVTVERIAKRLCPVDTGRLRASISHTLEEDSYGPSAVIGTNVEYGPHVEFGTRFMAAQPFLRPALQAAVT